MKKNFLMLGLLLLATVCLPMFGEETHPHRIIMSGKLIKTASIGGETTGWAIQTCNEGQIDIDPKPHDINLLPYQNKYVKVEGEFLEYYGVERGSYPVLVIDAISPSDKIVNLQTVYLTNSINGAHHISVQGELGGQGFLMLDPNICTLSPFGDPELCTKMGMTNIEIRIKKVDIPDPQGRLLYQLNHDMAHSKWSYFLVVPAKEGNPYRLIIEEGHKTRFVALLESKIVAPITIVAATTTFPAPIAFITSFVHGIMHTTSYTWNNFG